MSITMLIRQGTCRLPKLIQRRLAICAQYFMSKKFKQIFSARVCFEMSCTAVILDDHEVHERRPS